MSEKRGSAWCYFDRHESLCAVVLSVHVTPCVEMWSAAAIGQRHYVCVLWSAPPSIPIFSPQYRKNTMREFVRMLDSRIKLFDFSGQRSKAAATSQTHFLLFWAWYLRSCCRASFWWSQHIRSPLREFLQIWHKRSHGLKVELIRFWWSKVKAAVTERTICLVNTIRENVLVGLIKHVFSNLP